MGRKRQAINQKKRSLDRKISQLVINLEAKGPAKDASRIEHVEFMGKLARKEYVDHKLIVYKTFAGYLEREVPKVNKVIHKSDEDEASRKWYSINLL